IKFVGLAIITFLCTTVFLTLVVPIAAQDLHTSDQDTGSVPLPDGVTPDITIKTDIYLSFRPNPVGLNQIFLVNIWNDPGPSYARFFRDYRIILEKPDGTQTTITMNSYPADGTAWFEYIADMVGEWKIKFIFDGGYFPPGKYTVPEFEGSRSGYTEEYTKSVYYLPDSTDWQSLTVTEELVAPWPEEGPPTDYWTRPVSPENRDWYPILGNYPWNGPARDGPEWDAQHPDTNRRWNQRQRFTPYVQAPDSAHGVWRQLEGIAGIMGGDYGGSSQTSGGNTPSIIYAGRCYDSLTRVVDGQSQSVWTCYDLRTGEVYWEYPGVSAPSYIEYSEGGVSVPGGSSRTVSVSLVRIGGGSLQKFDPTTGRMTLDVDLPSNFRSTEYYMNGYAVSTQIISDEDNDFRLINWTTAGSARNFADRVMSNITFPLDTLGQSRDWNENLCFVIRETNAWDPNGLKPISGFPYVDITVDGGTGIRHGHRMICADLITGELLYDVTYDDEPYSAAQAPYSQSVHISENGKLALLLRRGYFNFYNSRTGELLYQSETMDYPWDEPAFGAYTIASAYGNIYWGAYSGVYAFDWDTGDIVWKYEQTALSQFETPYTNEDGVTVYSWNGGVQVADGKVFWENDEHTPSQPYTRGWGIHCIDAFTGEGIWNITSQMTPGAIADGYLTADCDYDGYTYVFGKGQSETTVTGPDIAVPKGTALTIKGTVLDLSPAQPGTPCVSAESMATQMEYLHFQQPIGGLWGDEIIKGVPVTLTAIGSDGSCVDIGTTITSGYYGTFGFAWTPEQEGSYEIVASFAGDESYGSSGASTFVTVGPAAAAGGTIEPESLISTELAIALAVVAVAVIVVVGFLVLKKRQ
ncbi:MAG: hypothetical protein CW716_08295, partial [Candidatus Bathyarchaeum sp.]